MTPEPSWPWQPHHRLPPPVRAILSFLGWGLAIVMAYFLTTYIIDYIT